MKTIVLLIAAAVLAVSCEDSNGGVQDWPWDDPVTDLP
jgi:hypothetical protein